MLAVDVTVRWGDRTLGIERCAVQRNAALSLRGALAEVRVRRDASGAVWLTSGAGRHPVALTAGTPVDLVVGEPCGPYRSADRSAVVVRVELASCGAGGWSRAVRTPAAAGARRRQRAAALAALALHSVLAISAYVCPALGADDDTAIEPDARLPHALPSNEPWPLVDVEEPRVRQSRELPCGSSDDCARLGWEAAVGAFGAPASRGDCRPASRVHLARAGESLSSIAAAYGFDDYRALYDPETNPELVDERPDPNRILIGDLVRIPDRHGQQHCVDGTKGR